MRLHTAKELFKQMILTVSEALDVHSGIIEKDYYVTMFLKNLYKYTF